MFSDTDYSSLLIIEVISFICVPNTKRHSCWRRMLSSLSVTYRSFSSIYKLTNIYSDLLLNSLSAARILLSWPLDWLHVLSHQVLCFSNELFSVEAAEVIIESLLSNKSVIPRQIESHPQFLAKLPRKSSSAVHSQQIVQSIKLYHLEIYLWL